MLYVRVLFGITLFFSSASAYAEVFNNVQSGRVSRCAADDGVLTVCVNVNGARLPLRADFLGNLFITINQNGTQQFVRAPQSVVNDALQVYQQIFDNFRANGSFNPNDPGSFRDEQHRQFARRIVFRNTGIDPFRTDTFVRGGLDRLDFNDATVERCSFNGVNTICARINNQRFLLQPDSLGRISININGRFFQPPQSLVDKTIQLYQRLFDKRVKENQPFDPNNNDSFRDENHLRIAAQIVRANTGIDPLLQPGTTFVPSPSPTFTPDQFPDLLGDQVNGNHGGTGGGTGGVQRPALEGNKSLFQQRKEKFTSREQTQKPDLNQLKKAIGDPVHGGLTFVEESCVYEGSNKMFDRSLAIGMKSDGSIYAQMLPKSREGKVTLDQLEANGVALKATEDPPPALRGSRTSSELSATPMTRISVRAYQDSGQTKYLVRFAQQTGPDDDSPVVAFCAPKTGTAAMKPVDWKDATKPTTARMANLFASSCAKCHGPSSHRKVKFNPDGTLLLTNMTREQAIQKIIARVNSTDPEQVMPPTLSDSDRAKLRELTNLWAVTVPLK